MLTHELSRTCFQGSCVTLRLRSPGQALCAVADFRFRERLVPALPLISLGPLPLNAQVRSKYNLIASSNVHLVSCRRNRQAAKEDGTGKHERGGWGQRNVTAKYHLPSSSPQTLVPPIPTSCSAYRQRDVVGCMRAGIATPLPCC